MNTKALPTTLGLLFSLAFAIALTFYVVSRWDPTLPTDEAWKGIIFTAGFGIALLPGPFLFGCLLGAKIEASREGH